MGGGAGVRREAEEKCENRRKTGRRTERRVGQGEGLKGE